MLRRLGWLGAVTLLGAALLIPGTSALATDQCPQDQCTSTSSTTSTTSTTTDETTTTSTGDVSETTSTNDESTTTDETTSSSSTVTTTTDETTSTGTTVTETGGVGGETGTPDVTPPSTSSLPGNSGSSDGWRFILLGLAGIAVLSLILLPGDRKSKQR